LDVFGHYAQQMAACAVDVVCITLFFSNQHSWHAAVQIAQYCRECSAMVFQRATPGTWYAGILPLPVQPLSLEECCGAALLQPWWVNCSWHMDEGWLMEEGFYYLGQRL
jgi:hypothetical protein